MPPASSPFCGGLATARLLLHERFGHTAFRVHQLKVVGPLLAGRSVLAVLPTGAGKSLCFQLPALMAPGLTLVVSPLISLMQDQVGALRRRGIAAAYLNSLLTADQRRVILEQAVSGRLGILYCAPERLPGPGRPPGAAPPGGGPPAAGRAPRIPHAETVVTSFDRPNLVFRVERVRDDRARFARLRELVRGHDGSSIVYTPTRRLTELV